MAALDTEERGVEMRDPVVLFDFGDTLADQAWMGTDLGKFEGWTDAFLLAHEPLADDWGLGRVSTDEVAAAIDPLFAFVRAGLEAIAGPGAAPPSG